MTDAVVHGGIVRGQASSLFASPAGANAVAPKTYGLPISPAVLVGAAHLCHRARSFLPKARGKTGLISALTVSVVALLPAIRLSPRCDRGVALRSYERVWFALDPSGLTIAIHLVTQRVRGPPALRLLLPPIGRRMVNP